MITDAKLKHCTAEQLDPISDLGRLVAFFRTQIISRIDEVMLPMDLTSAQYIIVINLAKGYADTPASLCMLLDYDRGAMSRLLQRMEHKELIRREPDPEDRRCVRIRLTEKGHALYPQIMPTVDHIYEEALVDFSEQERKTLTTLLFRAIKNLR